MVKEAPKKVEAPPAEEEGEGEGGEVEDDLDIDLETEMPDKPEVGGEGCRDALGETGVGPAAVGCTRAGRRGQSLLALKLAHCAGADCPLPACRGCSGP